MSLWPRRTALVRREPPPLAMPAVERRDAGGSMVAIGGFGGAAQSVSTYAAENLSTVTACVGAIASAIATLPATVYRRDPAGRVEQPNHPVSRLIRGPCDRLTWPDWLEFTVAQCLLHGNSISIIEYDGAGRPTALIPVPWGCVQLSLMPSGNLAYDIAAFVTPWGGSGQPRRYFAGEVFHLRDRSDDGYLGRSRLSRAPQVLDAALGIQTYSAAIWRNNASPSGVIQHKARLNPEAKSFLRQEWNDMHQGTSNSQKTGIPHESPHFDLT